MFNHNPNLSFNKKKLKKTFAYCYITELYFVNGKFFSQIDGVAM